MSDDMQMFHEIIYRALFGMDRGALLIRLSLPPDTYVGDDDDEMLDHVGTLALQAITDCHMEFRKWMLQYPIIPIPKPAAKSALRQIADMIAKRYKTRANELGGELLTEMRL